MKISFGVLHGERRDIIAGFQSIEHHDPATDDSGLRLDANKCCPATIGLDCECAAVEHLDDTVNVYRLAGSQDGEREKRAGHKTDRNVADAFHCDSTSLAS